MKESFYKNLSLSFFLIIIWTIYLFFDYFIEPKGLFYGFGLLTNFLYSCFFALALGTLMIILWGFILKYKVRINKINFFLLFSGVFNLLIFILFIISITLKILNYDINALCLFGGNLILSLIIGLIIKKEFKIKNPLN
jgi:hypothetical protein